MPLDPLAKRLLAMMAAASPADRFRPTADERRQALAKLMQFARADVTAAAGIDDVLPGPGGDLRLPALYAGERYRRALAGLRVLPWRRHGGRQPRYP